MQMTGKSQLFVQSSEENKNYLNNQTESHPPQLVFSKFH